MHAQDDPATWLSTASIKSILPPGNLIDGPMVVSDHYFFFPSKNVIRVCQRRGGWITPVIDHFFTGSTKTMALVDDSTAIALVGDTLYEVTPQALHVLDTIDAEGRKQRLVMGAGNGLVFLAIVTIDSSEEQSTRLRLMRLDAGHTLSLMDELEMDYGLSSLFFDGRQVVLAIGHTDSDELLDLSIDGGRLRFQRSIYLPSLAASISSSGDLLGVVTNGFGDGPAVYLFRRVPGGFIQESIPTIGLWPSQIICNDTVAHVRGDESVLVPPTIVTLARGSTDRAWRIASTSNVTFPLYGQYSNWMSPYRGGVIVADASGYELVRDTVEPTRPRSDYWRYTFRCNAISGNDRHLLLAGSAYLYSVEVGATDSLSFIDSLETRAMSIHRLNDTAFVVTGDSVALIRMDDRGKLSVRDRAALPFRRPSAKILAIDSTTLLVGSMIEGACVVRIDDDRIEMRDTIRVPITDMVMLDRDRALLSTYGDSLTILDVANGFARSRAQIDSFESRRSIRAMGMMGDTLVALSNGSFNCYLWSSSERRFERAGYFRSPVLTGLYSTVSFTIQFGHLWIASQIGQATVIFRLDSGRLGEPHFSIPGPFLESLNQQKQRVWVAAGHHGIVLLHRREASVSGTLRSDDGGKLTLFPNPARDEVVINVPMSAPLQLYVCSARGDAIARVDCSPQEHQTIARWDCSTAATGLYIVVAVDEHGLVRGHGSVLVVQ